MLAQLHTPKDELPPAEAKPVFRNVLATVAAVDPAQSLYYEACPENNRKVWHICSTPPGGSHHAP